MHGGRTMALVIVVTSLTNSKRKQDGIKFHGNLANIVLTY